MSDAEAISLAIAFLNSQGFQHAFLRVSRQYGRNWLLTFENRPPSFDPAQDVTPAISVIVDGETGAVKFSEDLDLFG